MKQLIIGLTFITSILLTACQFNSGSGNVSITTQDNENELNFIAYYPEGKTKAVYNYIESYLKEQRIFKSIADMKKSQIILSDGTTFYLKYEPGFITINLEKNKNSFTSYNRIKKMVGGFSKALKD